MMRKMLIDLRFVAKLLLCNNPVTSKKPEKRVGRSTESDNICVPRQFKNGVCPIQRLPHWKEIGISFSKHILLSVIDYC